MISRFSDLKTNVFGRFFICGYGPLYLSDDLKQKYGRSTG